MKTLKKLFKAFWSWDYKEEFMAILVFLTAFLAINLYFSSTNPEAGLFNLPSQTETLVYCIMKYVLALILIWVGYRIIFPKAYQFFREEIYQKFDELPFDDKLNWALKILMILAFVATFSMSRAQTPQLNETRQNLVHLVKSQVGIHEITENDSPEIRKFLAHVGINRPAYWCVAWVSYDLSAVGVQNPKSAYSPTYARQKDIIWTPKNPKIKPLTGDVITVYFNNLGRVGHGCFYLETDKSGYFITGEGNANQKLSRTGGEVCIMKRDPQKIHAIARFIK
ncbi:MAG: hypothetical protein WAV01_02270 [Candidatus Saccharimonadales bacterium]